MDLIETKWPQRKFYFLRKRSTCADEVLARKSPGEGGFKAAKRTLGTLENAAKGNHDARLASDFAYGRKECSRLAGRSKVIQLITFAVLAGFLGWGEKLLNIVFSAALVVFLLARQLPCQKGGDYGFAVRPPELHVVPVFLYG